MWKWLHQMFFCSHPDTETEWITNQVGQVKVTQVSYWKCHQCGKVVA